MSLPVFLAVLLAALLHAAWNAALRMRARKLTAMLILSMLTLIQHILPEKLEYWTINTSMRVQLRILPSCAF